MNAPSERPLAALSGFEPVARGVPGEDANRASERDGLVCLTRAFGPECVRQDAARG